MFSSLALQLTQQKIACVSFVMIEEYVFLICLNFMFDAPRNKNLTFALPEVPRAVAYKFVLRRSFSHFRIEYQLKKTLDFLFNLIYFISVLNPR